MEFLLAHFVEIKRYQDFKKPGSQVSSLRSPPLMTAHYNCH